MEGPARSEEAASAEVSEVSAEVWAADSVAAVQAEAGRKECRIENYELK